MRIANKEDESPDIISIEDADDQSHENIEGDESQPISIDDTSDDPEAGDNQSDDEKNEETWKDDDFLSFRSDEEEEEEENNANEKRRGGKKKSSSSLLSQISSSYKHTVNSTNDTSFAAELPPWMEVAPRLPHHQYHQIPPLVKLHNEIVDFANIMAPQQDEIDEREKLTQRVKDLILSTFGGAQKCEVKVFGSQETGLFLPTSDIDMVVFLEDEKEVKKTKQKKKSQKEEEEHEMENWHIHEGTSPLVRLGDALASKWKDQLSYLEVLEKTRIPIVKFTHKPTNLSIDICFNQSTGIQAAELVKTLLAAMPPLKPLTFVLKYFLVARGLNEPYSGGIGSFMLQMMIVSYLQHRQREEHNYGRNTDKYTNLGSLLVEFLELYGTDFNYVTTGISIRNDGFYFPKGAKDRRENFWQAGRPNSLALENPFEITADVGRASFRMPLIQRSFDVAFKVLMSHVAEPVIPTNSILASILPPTEEMKKRATLIKVLNIENTAKMSGLDIQQLKTGVNESHHRHSGNNSHRENITSNNDSDMSASSEDLCYRHRKKKIRRG